MLFRLVPCDDRKSAVCNRFNVVLPSLQKLNRTVVEPSSFIAAPLRGTARKSTLAPRFPP
jgi:hypothetical protein